MNRKMTLVAFGVVCGGFGASGLTDGLGLSAATGSAAKNRSSSRPDTTTAPNPPPSCQRNSRRVGLQNSRIFCRIGRPPRGSVEVDELIEVQRQEAEAVD